MLLCLVGLWDCSRHYINKVLLNVLPLRIICVCMDSYKCAPVFCSRLNKSSFYCSRSATCLTMKALLRLPCSWQSGVSFSADLSWCVFSSKPLLWNLSMIQSYSAVSFIWPYFDRWRPCLPPAIHALPATLFLELWKRHRARHVSQWKVYDWCEEEVTSLSSQLGDMFDS